MHLYWRIKEELLYLGEILVFLDPRFAREYRHWEKRRLLSPRKTGASDILPNGGLGRIILSLNN